MSWKSLGAREVLGKQVKTRRHLHSCIYQYRLYFDSHDYRALTDFIVFTARMTLFGMDRIS